MNWTCPYCNRAQTITEPNFDTKMFAFQIRRPADGPLGIRGTAITCANEECGKASVSVAVVEATYNNFNGEYFTSKDSNDLFEMRLLPDNNAKPQPEFIPEPLRQDYIEACRIKDLSPKAAATLARRCLQGMIRDFCDIEGRTLYHEIGELKKRLAEDKAPRGVSEESIEAIDHVRQIGNIGAHMENDINVIIEVEPGEAQTLIELIETLFDEWYVARQNRTIRLENLKKISEQKQMIRRSLLSSDKATDKS